MFYKKLVINDVEYNLAVNLTGSGAPTEETEADVGMFYVDTDTDKVYIKNASGWAEFVSGGSGGKDGLSAWAATVAHEGRTSLNKTYISAVEDREIAVGDLILFTDGIVAKINSTGTNSVVFEKTEINLKGSDGYSPRVTVSKSGKVTTIGITDESGTKTATINDGADGSGGEAFPEGWRKAVDDVVGKIRSLHNNGTNIHDCLTFAFFTDTHNKIGHQGILIKEVLRRIGSRYCFFGGDAVDNGNLETEADMIANIDEFDEVMKVLPIEYDYRTIGNHDGMWKTSANVKNNQPWNKVYNEFFRRQTIPGDRHFGGSDFTYFYTDDENSKIRFVFLNSMWFDGVSAKANNGFGEEQISWLINEALAFNEEGWGIVFVSHAPLTNFHHSLLRDVRVVQGILTAYANKTSYTGSYSDSNTAHAVPTVSVDYSTGITAKIIGWFAGHIHRDMKTTTDVTTDPSNPVELPFFVVTTTSDLGYDYDVESTITGATDSDTGHVIDFVTINKSTKTVNITRLGASAHEKKDREYSYDVAETFSITNNFTNATNSNTATKVVAGGSYSATITAKSGYELVSVNVTMGGVAQSVTNGVINIPEVTGNIVITATVVEIELPPAYTNLFDYSKATINARINSSGVVQAESSYNGYFVSDLMPLPSTWKGDGTDIIRVYNPNNTTYNSTALSQQKAAYYAGSDWKVSAILSGNDTNNTVKVTTSNGIASFIGGKKSGAVDANAPSCTHFRLALAYKSSLETIVSTGQLDGVVVTVNEEIIL